MTDWLPLTEAALRLGISRDALWGRGKRGTHDTRPGECGRNLYAVPATKSLADLDALADVGAIHPVSHAEERLHKILHRESPRSRGNRRGLKSGKPLGAWVSDIHAPVHDEAAVRASLELIEDKRPDVLIIGGDLAEMASASSHGGAARLPSVLEDAEATNEMLDRYQEAAGSNCEVHLLEGNHETRLTRLIQANAPALFGSTTLPDLLHLRKRGIHWHAEADAPLRIGPVEFVHGFSHNQNHASVHARATGGVVVYGHTHRPQSWVKSTRNGRLAGYGMGCLRTLQPDWVKSKPSGWTHGFGVFEVDEMTGAHNVYSVEIHDGLCLFDGVTYGG